MAYDQAQRVSQPIQTVVVPWFQLNMYIVKLNMSNHCELSMARIAVPARAKAVSHSRFLSVA